MNIEMVYKEERQNIFFAKTGIATFIFMAAIIFFPYQVSYAQLNSSNVLRSSSDSGTSGDDDNQTSMTALTDLTGNENLSAGSFLSIVNDINNRLASNSSNSISNGTTNSQAEIPSFNLLSLEEITIQNTSMSVPAPVRHPGQPSHEVVFALPLRTDGNIWSGTVTFTASKPIEVEVLHSYVPIENPDSTHAEPYHAVLPGNKSIAITHLRHLVDVPIEINGTGMSSGTLNFAGNALVFHKTSGEPFTVTYTIDAVAKELTKLRK
jgi:maltodextrin utilization protein YvdJ